MQTLPPIPEATNDTPIRAIVGERLTVAAFQQLCGQLAGIPFVKVVVDREKGTIHFINHFVYQMHALYVGEVLLGLPKGQTENDIDAFNRNVYFDPQRRFYLGIISLHRREERSFFSLETVEVDAMNGDMIRYFFSTVREFIDPSLPLFLKPANHWQEASVAKIDPIELPRVFAHELFATSQYIALNQGHARGRLRFFADDAAYRDQRTSIEWYDIIAMERVPDDIPRVSGIINTMHTTPLSHTNVLAAGWQIPNAVQLRADERIKAENLDQAWVEYIVQFNAAEIVLKKIDRPAEVDQRPAWSVNTIKLEEPETINTPIVSLDRLRMRDRSRYGTKAANLGELHYVMNQGSSRLSGFYKIKRPPRANLLSYLIKLLGTAEDADLNQAAWEFLQSFVRLPRGIAIPFSIQQEFLESSPQIQQAIGKLKMALELNARQVDSLCVNIQQMIRQTRINDKIRNYIDDQIATHLSGVSSFVVRSSSNAEDLENFSAAGIYESINHVTTAENIFESIKQVWASLLSLRSVRLRQEVGISLDACYMGVIVQEESPASLGGVLVTANPLNKADFRNVYFNISPKSVEDVVQGSGEPFQYLYNTVEGGGRTLSLGRSQSGLSHEQKNLMQKLAVAGRLLQSHFSPDYTFSAPVDIEWLLNGDVVHILQLRPFAR